MPTAGSLNLGHTEIAHDDRKLLKWLVKGHDVLRAPQGVGGGT